MTAQQVLDKVYRHFIIEGNPRAVDEYGGCWYRTDDGRKCAVGIFIPDDAYTPEMEGLSVFDPLVCASNPVFMEHKSLLTELQEAHDSRKSADPAHFRQQLTFVAKMHGLEVPA